MPAQDRPAGQDLTFLIQHPSHVEVPVKHRLEANIMGSTPPTHPEPVSRPRIVEVAVQKRTHGWGRPCPRCTAGRRFCSQCTAGRRRCLQPTAWRKALFTGSLPEEALFTTHCLKKALFTGSLPGEGSVHRWSGSLSWGLSSKLQVWHWHWQWLSEKENGLIWSWMPNFLR